MPIDQLAVNFHVARAAVREEIKALDEAGKGKGKKPKTSEDFSANLEALKKIHNMQG